MLETPLAKPGRDAGPAPVAAITVVRPGVNCPGAIRRALPQNGILVEEVCQAGLTSCFGGRLIGSELHSPDVPVLAASFGIPSRRVHDPADSEAAAREPACQAPPVVAA